MDGSIERLIEGLEAKFDALLAREEEAAADDLAGSLERGMSLPERLRAGDRALALVFPGGARAPVNLVGPDHLGCGSPIDAVAPIGSAVTVQETGVPPTATDLTMTQALRPWADGRRRVEVNLWDGASTYLGHLVLVASDHLILEKAGIELVIPFSRMGSIRLSREG